MTARFNVCGKLFMIDYAKLVGASSYFAALLDGPLAACKNSSGSIDLAEQDVDTLTELFYFIRNGKLSLKAESCKQLYANLLSMADFYFVDLLPQTDTTQTRIGNVNIKQVHIYEVIETLLTNTNDFEDVRDSFEYVVRNGIDPYHHHHLQPSPTRELIFDIIRLGRCPGVLFKVVSEIQYLLTYTIRFSSDLTLQDLVLLEPEASELVREIN